MRRPPPPLRLPRLRGSGSGGGVARAKDEPGTASIQLAAGFEYAHTQDVQCLLEAAAPAAYAPPPPDIVQENRQMAEEMAYKDS